MADPEIGLSQTSQDHHEPPLDPAPNESPHSFFGHSAEKTDLESSTANLNKDAEKTHDCKSSTSSDGSHNDSIEWRYLTWETPLPPPVVQQQMGTHDSTTKELPSTEGYETVSYTHLTLPTKRIV